MNEYLFLGGVITAITVLGIWIYKYADDYVFGKKESRTKC